MVTVNTLDRLEVPLAKYACRSGQSKGRKHEDDGDYRLPFQVDRDRILNAKPFRRLAHKTQAFALDESDHVRTRLTHSLEVCQIARNIGRLLDLNEDLIGAIALGHDLGHAPFGHAGEKALDECLEECASECQYGLADSCPGFAHNVQGVRNVEFLEVLPGYPRDKGWGLNLTFEVREGILKHTDILNPHRPPSAYARGHVHGRAYQSFRHESFGTLEAQVVRISDKIAYTVADLDDAFRVAALQEMRDAGVVNSRMIDRWMESCGADATKGPNAIIGPLVLDVFETTRRNVSADKIHSADRARDVEVSTVNMSDGMTDRFRSLRDWLQANVYRGSKATVSGSLGQRVVRKLFKELLEHPEILPLKTLSLYRAAEKAESSVDGVPTCPVRIIADHIAGMTDRYALDLYDQLRL